MLRISPCSQWTALLSTALLLTCLLGCDDDEASTAAPPSGLEADPWVPMDDAAMTARIAEARAQAERHDRKVLLVFVADWCEDCHEVVRLSREEPARSVLTERYIVVFVEVGRFDRHRGLIDTHGIDRIAALVVLDPRSGERIAKGTLEPITGPDRGLTSEALARWLRNPS